MGKSDLQIYASPIKGCYITCYNVQKDHRELVYYWFQDHSRAHCEVIREKYQQFITQTKEIFEKTIKALPKQKFSEQSNKPKWRVRIK